MKIQEVHAAIMEFLPEQSFVVVAHTFRNYSRSGDKEEWSCQLYENDDSPLENIVYTNSTTPKKLIAVVKTDYDEYIKNKPTVADEIESLKRRLAKLQGEV